MKKLKYLLILPALFLLLAIGVSVADYYEPPKFNHNISFTEQVNNHRQAEGLKPLKENKDLSKIAKTRCDDMVEHHYFDHRDIRPYFNEHYNLIGENLAEGYWNDLDTTQAWLNSETHRENILEPVYTEAGDYTCWNGEKYLTVQIFKG